MKMNIKNLVKSMKSREYYKLLCLKETDLLKKCILCKHYLNSQEWAIMMENFIKEQTGINNKVDNISGDGEKFGYNFEIKVSLGSQNGQFNFVQIRPDHNIDYYILIGYDIFEGTFGKVYVMKIPSVIIHDLIIEYGSYAHGTISKLGKIHNSNIKGRNLEFALRPNPQNTSNTVAYKLWKVLLKYEIDFKKLCESFKTPVQNILNTKIRKRKRSDNKFIKRNKSIRIHNLRRSKRLRFVTIKYSK